VRVRFRTEAASDLESAAAWYGKQREGLGQEFVAAVGQVLELVADRPDAFPLVAPRVRRSLVRRFPYAVYYRVEEAFIDVIGCLHTRRSPSIRRSRR
jgi:plasmid stabilization system protein ParE